MRRDKRRWIYSGAGVPPGVALVRPPARRLAPAAGRVLLVGGPIARGLGPPLGRLAADSKVGLRMYTDPPGAPSPRPLDAAWLRTKVAEYRPSIVLVALEPDPKTSGVVEKLIRRYGAQTLWLPLTGKMANALSAETLHLVRGSDRMAPTAAGYAAWAAAIWRMIR